ncbi:MAG: hypothetical protein J5819_07930, partial [Eubacterium sp.]|nr:hypothetical protein [Eubacterium sp.]
MKRNLKKILATGLSLALALSLFGVTPGEAAKKRIKLSKSSVNVKVNASKKITVKGVNKKRIKRSKVRSKKKMIADVEIVSKKAFRVCGKKKGDTKVTFDLRLKKKVNGKKKYKLTLKVHVKNAGPAPTSQPTAKPTATAVPTEEPLIPATGITLSGAETCATGEAVRVEAALTPENSNDEVTWSSSNTSVATIWSEDEETKYLDADAIVIDPAVAAAATGPSTSVAANGMTYAWVYGVSYGETTITAKTGNHIAQWKVTVAEPDNTPILLNVNQVTANKVELEFDRDTNELENPITKGQIEINELNDEKQEVQAMPVNNIKVSEDGTIITVQVAGFFIDKKNYRFKYAKTAVEKVMSCGPVIGVSVTTSMAEVNIATPIQFMLLDANGIDVTEAHKLDKECSIDSKGDGMLENNRASKSTIKFEKVGDRSDVTVSWKDPDKTDAKEIEGKATIICVGAKARTGTPRFKGIESGTKDWGGDEKVARFYVGEDSKVITVREDGTNSKIWFCVEGDDGNIINYDEYSIKSSNDRVMDTVSCEGHGRYAQMKITGVKAGSANIVVKAVFNGKASTYVIPVVVKKKPTIKKIELNQSNATLTNAMENAYAGSLAADVIDSEGGYMLEKDFSIEWKVIGTPNGTRDVALFDEGINGNDPINKSHGTSITFSAGGLKKGNYTIKATATSAVDGKQVFAQKTFKVEDVYNLSWEGNPNPNCKNGKAVVTSGAIIYEVAAPKFVEEDVE